MKKFSGTVVTLYRLDGTIYGIAEEYEKGKTSDAELYAVDSMTDSELWELVNVGGVFVAANTPKIKYQQLVENGVELAKSVITDEGVDWQSCNTDDIRIKRAFQ